MLLGKNSHNSLLNGNHNFFFFLSSYSLIMLTEALPPSKNNFFLFLHFSSSLLECFFSSHSTPTTHLFRLLPVILKPAQDFLIYF